MDLEGVPETMLWPPLRRWVESAFAGDNPTEDPHTTDLVAGIDCPFEA